MTDQLEPTASGKRRPRARLLLAAAGLLAIGGAAGAVIVHAERPSVTMAPMTPVAIRTLGSSGIVTIRGSVVEIYGNKFILADASGRALVDAGREGEGGGLVTAGEAVTVQGRFDDGVVHAAFLVAPGGKVTALGPLAGPPHDHRRPGGPHDDAPPPPPPPRGDGPAPVAPAAATNAT
ncbi:hypothetical protein [Sphingomonas gei]|uniref:hypothetical protein n=1 Tax=Sphingomonas gei TaxID=1395960 RepID=UPI0019D28F07|nr:hypothetical protein [Sphingomonas gei]